MKFAFVFPGQGSQSVGMLNVFSGWPVVQETLAQASDILEQDIGALIMQEAVPEGAGSMAAILVLDAQSVRALCTAVSALGTVEAVNFNAPTQTVIAGQRNPVETVCKLALSAGAQRAVPLPVSAPFHSSLLKPAADRLSA